jgi:SAM-dependent methyltransferase
MEYSEYINLQKSKTTDPKRREKWLTQEWDLKLNGFKKIFNNNINFIGNKCLCIGARTGQEVQALLDMEKSATGIDLVPCKPLVEEGDFHNLPYNDEMFDFVFTNVFDHALYPDKFCSEAFRVLKKGGYGLFHLQVNTPNDEYGVNDISNLNKQFLNFFSDSKIEKNTQIYYNEFCTFNKEVVLRKL